MIKSKFLGLSYPARFATIFSFLVLVVLSVPMIVYATIMLNLEEARTEQELHDLSSSIIRQMDRFDPKSEDLFYFPRFKSYEAGLYRQQNVVFSTMTHPLPSLSDGYNKEGNFRYYVTPLPTETYFHATHLIVVKSFETSTLWVRLLVTALLILCLVFVASYLLNKEFEKPFRQVNTRLDNFIKDSMHEINTPLAIIYANIDLFREKYGQSVYLSRIRSAAKTLSMIYNDMDYMIKRERLSYPDMTICFDTFLLQRIEYFSEIAAMKHITFTTDVTPNIMIRFNDTQLSRLIDNNLSNAIKYSHEESTIHVMLKRENDRSVLSIEDHGIGIDKPEAIFERFYREDEAKGGFGIGLAIVKSICDERHVDVHVTSVITEGTTFRYTFYDS